VYDLVLESVEIKSLGDGVAYEIGRSITRVRTADGSTDPVPASGLASQRECPVSVTGASAEWSRDPRSPYSGITSSARRSDTAELRTMARSLVRRLWHNFRVKLIDLSKARAQLITTTRVLAFIGGMLVALPRLCL
jgi:hypothetical protein